GQAVVVADGECVGNGNDAGADGTHARLSGRKLIPPKGSGQSGDQERPVDAHHWSVTPAARHTAGASAAGTGPAFRRTSWRPDTVTSSRRGSNPSNAAGARAVAASQAARAACSLP